MAMHHIDFFKYDNLYWTRKTVLMALCAMADDEGFLYAESRDVRGRVCLSLHVVEKAIRDLEQAGYLVKIESTDDAFARYLLRREGSRRNHKEAYKALPDAFPNSATRNTARGLRG
jgi:DNA-binding MarR family transcriptional regulator